MCARVRASEPRYANTKKGTRATQAVASVQLLSLSDRCVSVSVSLCICAPHMRSRGTNEMKNRVSIVRILERQTASCGIERDVLVRDDVFIFPFAGRRRLRRWWYSCSLRRRAGRRESKLYYARLGRLKIGPTFSSTPEMRAVRRAAASRWVSSLTARIGAPVFHTGLLLKKEKE